MKKIILIYICICCIFESLAQNAEKYFIDGNKYFQEGEYSQAIACYDKAIEISPNITIYRKKALACYFYGDYIRSIEAYKKIIKLNPNDEDAYMGKYDAYCKLNDIENANRVYKETQRINPGIENPHKSESPVPKSFHDKRLALIIGNGAYSGAGQLINSTNDADSMKQKLEKLRFETILIKNKNYRDTRDIIRDFANKAKEYDVALFFYAGHALQHEGKNYLIPIDAQLITEHDLNGECIDVNGILSQLEESQCKMKLVILDACRNNPFLQSSRGVSQGLAFINAPTGTLIAYSTSAGKTAADGFARPDKNQSENSPYTTGLLQTLDMKGLNVENVFKQVRIRVMRITYNQQIPWESTSLIGDFYFNR